MKSILEELYYGNLDPNTLALRSPAHQKTMQAVADGEESLCAALTGREKSLFLDFANAQAALSGIVAVESFSGGFALGCLLMADVFGRRESLLSE